MNTLYRIAAAAVFAAALAGCNTAASSQVGTVDIARIQTNWPKFLNYQNQLSADAQAIDRANLPDAAKARQRADLQNKFVSLQNELTGDVRTAAEQVAGDKHLKLVVTREFVGYGGVDITPDIEKILKITETATPKP